MLRAWAKRNECEGERLAALRERLKGGILSQLDEVYINGHPLRRLPGNLNMSFAYIEGESLLMALKEIAVSTGSACYFRRVSSRLTCCKRLAWK